MEVEMKRIIFTTEEEKFKNFKSKMAQRGVTMSFVLNQAVDILLQYGSFENYLKEDKEIFG